MDIQLKQRLIGAVILSAIMVSLVVMLLDNSPAPTANSAPSGKEAPFRSSIMPAEDTKPPPSLATAPVDHTAWVVQLGSFSNAKNALRLRDKLRSNGFTTFIETVQINNKQRTRVYVGPEMGQAKAEAAHKKLEKNFKMKGLVVKYSE